MAQEKELWARKATGLVREWTQLDFFIYNIIGFGVWVGMALAPLWGFVGFPGANQSISWIIAIILVAFANQPVYAMVMSAMPRTGQPYPFQARVLHPLIGYVVNFTMIITVAWLWPAFGLSWMRDLSVVPFFGTMGYLTGSKLFTDLGAWWASTTGLVVFQVGGVLAIAFVASIGMKRYALWQRLCMIFAGISMAIVTGVFLFASQPQFVSAVNGLLSANGVPDGYNAIINQAKSSGWDPTFTFTWTDTIAYMVVIGMFGYTFTQWGSYQAGEVKGVQKVKTNMTYMIGGAILIGLYLLVSIWAYTNVGGHDFLSSAGYLFYVAGNSPLPMPPYITMFAGLISGSVLLVVLIFLGMLGLSAINAMTGIMPGRGTVFAMAWDRMLPMSFAKVNEKYHIPFNNIILQTVMALIFIAIVDLNPAGVGSWIGGLMGMLYTSCWICFLTTSVAAAILPWRRPEMYRASPVAKWQVGGIPLITIVGVANTAFMLILAYANLVIPIMGGGNMVSIGVLVGFYIISAILYFAFKYYRKSQGIDIEQIYREIPAE
jgi:basic amino acid/polyamine antiporter, APA family